MKKALIGCLVTGLLLFVVGAGLAWWYFVRPAWDHASSSVESVKQWAKAADIEKSVTNQATFTPPEDGLLTPAQVQTFIAIQDAVSAAMGQDAEALKKKFEAMDAQNKAAGKDTDFTQAMSAVSDLGGLVSKAREAQVAELNRRNLSLDEYRWIRAQAMAAMPFVHVATADVPAASATVAAPLADAPSSSGTVASPPIDDEAMARLPPDARKAVEAARAAGEKARAAMQELNNQPDVKAARANAALLRPYQDKLEKLLSSSWVSM